MGPGRHSLWQMNFSNMFVDFSTGFWAYCFCFDYCAFLVIFGQGYQRFKVLVGLGHFWPRLPTVKVFVFLSHFRPKIPMVKDNFGQGYFYWPLWLWIPLMKVMFTIWDFERPLASRSAKREFAFAGGNLWNPIVQAGVRDPGGNCWHGIASTSILVHR